MRETVDVESSIRGFDETEDEAQGNDDADDDNCVDTDRYNSLRIKLHKVINIIRLIII